MKATPKITDTAILDEIVRKLEQGDMDCDKQTYIHYEDSEGITINASIRWIVESYHNYIDGYFEGEYDEVTGWQDLEVDAYIGDEKTEIDEEYIFNHLTA